VNAPPIDHLIDKLDTSEIVGEAIATILKIESTSQAAKAAALGKDPDLWSFRVFREASTPFAEFQEAKQWERPIVNVWWANANFDKRAGNVVSHQQAVGTFNVDVYGYAMSKSTSVGHSPGDQDAALEAQRAMRLVRNILLAATYTYLGLRKTVGARWPSSIQTFQPTMDRRPVQNVAAVRLSLEVTYNELSPQVTGEAAEVGTVQVRRNDITGEIYLTSQFDLTPS
jgi:hypothetical protein